MSRFPLRSLLMASLFALYWHPRQDAPPENVLTACPGTPNCVSTDATRESQRVPTIAFTDSPDSALKRARAAILGEPRSVIKIERAGYLHAECRSLIFRFVDDVDIVIDSAAHVFRMRSASRVGRSDMGVNRKRVERIAERLRQPPR